MRKKTSTDTTPFTFRLERADRDWLEATAKTNGVEVSQLVRWAIETLRQYVLEHGGKLHLPISIRDFWAVAQRIGPQQDEVYAAIAAHQLRAAESPPGTDPPAADQPRQPVQFEPAAPAKRRRQQ